MNKTLIALTAATLCGFTMACESAPTETADGFGGSGTSRTCFMPTDLADWAEVSLGNFVVRTNRNDYFHSRIGGDCIDIDWAQQIAIRPGFGSRRVCEGTNADILTRDMDGRRPRSCTAFGFRKLTDQEVAALPDSIRQ